VRARMTGGDLVARAAALIGHRVSLSDAARARWDRAAAPGGGRGYPGRP
jgi:hypothetical protein